MTHHFKLQVNALFYFSKTKKKKSLEAQNFSKILTNINILNHFNFPPLHI